jgi:hypothetical protein
MATVFISVGMMTRLDIGVILRADTYVFCDEFVNPLEFPAVA